MKCQIHAVLWTIFYVAFFSTNVRSEEKPVFVGMVFEVNALVTNNGFVYCDLYDSDKGFPDDPARALTRVKVRPERTKATCIFPDMKAGRYAVALWHDVNADQKLDMNWVGIPTEPVGASNNAKGKLGPPKFQAAAFEYRPPFFKQIILLE